LLPGGWVIGLCLGYLVGVVAQLVDAIDIGMYAVGHVSMSRYPEWEDYR